LNHIQRFGAMAAEETPVHVNRQLLALRIRYKDRSASDSRVTSIAFDADRTTVREAIDVACPKFGIIKPEMYGFAYMATPAAPAPGSPKAKPGQQSPTGSKSSSQYGMMRKKTIRDDTEWIPEVKTLAEAGLVAQVRFFLPAPPKAAFLRAVALSTLSAF
jgi:hypothetical protein